jgi:hypothetical protein
MRKFGLDVVGDIPWGTHLCQFYDCREDLVAVLLIHADTAIFYGKQLSVSSPSGLRADLHLGRSLTPELDRVPSDMRDKEFSPCQN